MADTHSLITETETSVARQRMAPKPPMKLPSSKAYAKRYAVRMTSGSQVVNEAKRYGG